MRSPFGNSRDSSRSNPEESPSAKVKRANAAKKAGQHAEASRLYQAAIKELGENHNEVWKVAVNNLGNLILLKGDLKQARSFYELAANNGLIEAMFNAGYINELLKMNTEALYWYKKAASAGHKRAPHKVVELEPKVTVHNNSKTNQSNSQPKTPPRPKPNLRLIRTPRDAELVARDWMVYYGFDDAKATPVGSDHGIDVTSSRAIAQVKFKGSKTPRSDIQLLHSNTVTFGKRGLFFSWGGYAKPAIEFANEVRIALFMYDMQGEPQPVNETARYVASQK